MLKRSFFVNRYANAEKLRDVKVYAVTQALPPRKGENLFIRAKNVLTTIENYLASADDNISLDHAPDFRMNEKTGLKEHIDQESKMVSLCGVVLEHPHWVQEVAG